MGSHIQSAFITCLAAVMEKLIQATSGREGLFLLTVAWDKVRHGGEGSGRKVAEGHSASKVRKQEA